MNRYIPFACLLTLVLAACSGPEPQQPSPRPGPVTPQPAEPQDPVERLLVQAGRTSGSEAAALQLEAAQQLLERGETARAREAIADLAPARLPPTLRTRHALVMARCELAEKQPAAALARLSDPAVRSAAGSADRALTVEFGRTRADALLGTGQAEEAARELVMLQPWLGDDGQRMANARLLLQALAQVPLASLEKARAEAATDDWRAWLELASVLRDLRVAPAAQRRNLQQWQARNARLAALETATTGLVPEIDARIANPSRVALLLPLSGRAAPSGHAVLQGYLAERYRQLQAGEPPPPLAVIDSAAGDGGFAAAYQRAGSDGATLVVGPLLKEELAAFGAGLTASVPTLALNFLDDTTLDQQGLYEFGIDTGDEISQLVAAGRQAGLERVMVLADRGARTPQFADQFTREWKAAGGATIDTLYLGEINEFRASLENSLLLDQSEQRTKALQQLLGVPLASEPRRRADLDLIVLLAEPSAARSIRSLMTYLYAGDVPVWGTSMSRAGGNAQEGDLDLQGLRFLDMPWFASAEQDLRDIASGAVPAGSLERLVALGADACRLQARLALFEWLPRAGLAGATGELSVAEQGRIRRRSDWFVMRGKGAVEEQPRARRDAAESREGVETWTEEPIPTTSAPVDPPKSVP